MTRTKSWPQERKSKLWVVTAVWNLFNAIIVNGLESIRDQQWAIVTDGVCIMTHDNRYHHVL